MSRGRPARSSGEISLPLGLALRYLRSGRRDAFVSFLSITAAGGLVLGVAALILALAALTGFQRALKREILARTPEIEIELPAAADAAAARDRVLEIPGVEAAHFVAGGRGWLMTEGRVRPVALVGFEGTLPATFPGLASAPGGLYVGDRLANAWGLVPGDVLEVASGRPTLTPLGPQPRVRRLPLAGVYATGRTELEDRVAMPLAAARSLLGPAGERLLVAAGGLEPALAVAPRVAAALPAGSRVRTWRDLNRGLLFALRLEKSLMFVAVFLIVVVSALALVSDLTLIIASKRAEIGMLGAMGMPPRGLRRVFVLLGGVLAGAGVAGGLALGVGGSWALDRFRLLRIPGEVYFLDHVPFTVRAGDVALVAGSVLLLALACTWLAARRAAELQPAEALRR